MSGSSVMVLRSVASTCVAFTSRILARGPGVDVEHQRRAIRLVRHVYAWGHARRRDSRGGDTRPHRLGHLVLRVRAGRAAKPLGDEAAKVVLDSPGAGEFHAIDRMPRHQHVLHAHAAASPAR